MGTFRCKQCTKSYKHRASYRRHLRTCKHNAVVDENELLTPLSLFDNEPQHDLSSQVFTPNTDIDDEEICLRQATAIFVEKEPLNRQPEEIFWNDDKNAGLKEIFSMNKIQNCNEWLTDVHMCFFVNIFNTIYKNELICYDSLMRDSRFEHFLKKKQPEVETIYFINHDSDHWNLIQADISKQKLKLHCSLNRKFSDQHYMRYVNILQSMYPGIFEWDKVENKNVFQQTDTTSCGYLVIFNLFILAEKGVISGNVDVNGLKIYLKDTYNEFKFPSVAKFATFILQ